MPGSPYQSLKSLKAALYTVSLENTRSEIWYLRQKKRERTEGSIVKINMKITVRNQSAVQDSYLVFDMPNEDDSRSMQLSVQEEQALCYTTGYIAQSGLKRTSDGIVNEGDSVGLLTYKMSVFLERSEDQQIRNCRDSWDECFSYIKLPTNDQIREKWRETCYTNLEVSQIGGSTLRSST
ncbi:unnamed protein product [Mytilus coruscus]|uniref:Uncharacterized protein n=1 Tax=Mytilus coruscus TaxID=42192 RepID=A0A6J8DCR0_MYTCO|nr:unnamed protein product [Mytilus coruscus]